MSSLTGPSAGGGGGPSAPPNTLIREYVAGVSVLDVVYQKPDGTVDKASASSTSTVPALGIVLSMDTPVVGQCYVQYAGDIFGFSGLVTGRVYIISKDPGKLLWEGDIGNVNYPNVSGNVVQQIGVAGSANRLQIDIQDQTEI